MQVADSRCALQGGAIHAKGNSSASAEFNFHADPEAAARVLGAFGARAEVVPWETTLSCPLPWEWAERGLLGLLLAACVNWVLLSFCLCRLIDCRYRRLVAEEENKDLILCDLIAAAVCLDPAAAAERRVLGARVALGGEARGALLLDWYGRHALPPLTLVERLDVPRVLEACRALASL